VPDGRGRADQRDSLLLHQQAAPGGPDILEATHAAALLRLRPIMITALVACLGLLPAAMSTASAAIPETLRHRDRRRPRLPPAALDFLPPCCTRLVAKKDDVLAV